METPSPGERREFDWVVDLDDPAMYAPKPLEEEEPPDEPEEPPPQPGYTRAHLREFLGPVLLALAYISIVSGTRWWMGG